ncbi:unnamed protein product [Cunninghamella echinulata]
MASSLIDQDNKINSDNNNINEVSTIQDSEGNDQKKNTVDAEQEQKQKQEENVEEKKVEKVEEEEEEEKVEEGEKSKVKNDTIENKSSEEDIKAAWTQAWDDNSQAYYWWNTITYESSWEDPNGTSTVAVSTEDPTITSVTDDENNNNNNDTTTTTQEELNPYEAIANTELDSVLDTIDREVKAKLDGKNTTTTTTNNAHSYNSSLSPSSSLNYNYNYYNTQQHQYGTMDPYRFQAHFNTKTGRFQTDSDTEQYTMESRAKRQMDHYFDSDAYQEQRNQQLHRGQKRPLSKKDVERFKQAKKEKKINKMRGWLQN